jgi:hypothetical protein
MYLGCQQDLDRYAKWTDLLMWVVAWQGRLLITELDVE